MTFPEGSFLPDINQSRENHAHQTTRVGRDAKGRNVTHPTAPATSSRVPQPPQDPQSSRATTHLLRRLRNTSGNSSTNTSPTNREPNHSYNNSGASSQRSSGVHSELPLQSSSSNESNIHSLVSSSLVFRRRDPRRGFSDGGSPNISSVSSAIPASRSREQTPFGSPNGSPLIQGVHHLRITSFTQNPPPLDLINSPLVFTHLPNPSVSNHPPAAQILPNPVQVNYRTEQVSSSFVEMPSSVNQPPVASAEYFQDSGMNKQDWTQLINLYRATRFE